MRQLRILVGCESSGRVRDALIALGHDATSCDLLPTESPGPHLQCDVLTVLGGGYDIGVFHPSCRYLAGSGMHWTTRGLRDPQLTVDAIAFVEKLWDAPIPFIGIENPTGVLSTRSKLGAYTCRVQPYEYGDDASKGTCLWTRNLPALVPDPALFVKPRMVCLCGTKKDYTTTNYDEYQVSGCHRCGERIAKPRWGNQTASGQNKLTPSDDRWKDRSRTYQGIANCIAQQWSAHVLKQS